MPRALQACHSYTLIKPGSGEKITIKRGQSIDNLSDADRAYLSRKTITPPSYDDSHTAPMRAPIFQEVIDEDVRGQAQSEPFNLNAGTAPAQGGGQRVEPVQVQVVVSPDAGVNATATVDSGDEDDADGDDGDAAGDADSGGAEDADEAVSTTDATAAKPAAKKRQSKARQSA